MNGNLMYEVARQRMAEQRQAAREAGEARALRAAARRRRARAEEPGATALPAIPDFADDMFEADRDAVFEPDAPGRRARPGR